MITRSCQVQHCQPKMDTTNCSINLFHDEIDKFYVKCGNYYAASEAAVVAAPADVVDFDTVFTTIVDSSSGPFIETKNIHGEYFLLFSFIWFDIYLFDYQFMATIFPIAAQCMDTNEYYATRGFAVAEDFSIPKNRNIMGLNKKFKFKSRAGMNLLFVQSNPGWECMNVDEIIPWQPTFKYLIPKIRKRKW